MSIVVSLVFAVFGAWLSVAWAEARSGTHQALAAKRAVEEALAEAIITLRARDAFVYMRETRERHDSLFNEYRRRLSGRSIAAYDAAVAAFANARDELVPAITEFTRRQVESERGVPSSKDAMILAIQNLLDLVGTQ